MLRRRAIRCAFCRAPQARSYARHADTPPRWPTSRDPTPYEIFGIAPSEPYTKGRFYQLVKLYHPDTHDPSTTSQATRGERYRLVVAANKLLSDPAKRRMYDDHGLGWTGEPHRAPTMREADRAWRHQPGSAARNATWEDWQRWREEQSGTAPREPMYMSNGMFAALVVAMCMVGAMAQANRAETNGAQYVDFVSQKDWAIGQQMQRSTLESAGQTKDQRVEGFLRDRENLAYDFSPDRVGDRQQRPG